VNNEPNVSGPTPGPGWWVDDEGVLRPPAGESAAPPAATTSAVIAPPVAASTATATATPVVSAPTPTPPRASPPDLPPVADSEAFGSAFIWACRAMRAHIGRLVLIGLVVVALHLVAGVVLLMNLVIVGAVDVAIVRAILGLLIVVVSVAVVAWSWLLLSRAWFRIARGDEVALDIANTAGFRSVVMVMVLLSPVWLFVGPVAFGFVVTALVLVHEPLTGSTAVGRMLAETFASARRFVHTLLIGLGVGAALVAWSAAVTGAVVYVVASLFVTAAPSAFDGNDGAILNLDTVSAALIGFGLMPVLGVLVAYAIFNLGGLWAAGHLRRVTGRTCGAPGSTTGN